jgi:hypothetical protein
MTICVLRSVPLNFEWSTTIILTHDHPKVFVYCHDTTVARADPKICLADTPKKGGDPSAPSDTDTLLRLSPDHQPHLERTYVHL